MPNRIIQDAILDSPSYHGLSSDSPRLLYFELQLLADDYGLVPVYPLFLSRRTASARRATDQAIAKMVSELADQDLVRVYEVNGQAYGYIPRFGNWPRAKKTKWPMPPDELGGREIKDLQQKRIASAVQAKCIGTASAPETETETETETESVNLRSTNEARKRAASGFDASLISLPEWLPRESWTAWVADRKERRKPITQRAAEAQIKALDGYRADGHSPAAVIANSIAAGYQGLFPPKVAQASAAGRAAPRPVLNADQVFTGETA